MLQIMAINTRNESFYSPADIELIMTSAAIAHAHEAHSVHINDRSLVQHNLGSASCMLLTRAPAVEVAFAAIHTFWYANQWTMDLNATGLCQVRKGLARVIGSEAEALLWRYSHYFLHGQDPKILQQHLGHLKSQGVLPLERRCAAL